MANRKAIERVDGYIRLLRTFGFVALHNHSGWMAMHEGGHIVVGNERRIKWERVKTVDGTPVVKVHRGPVDITWLNTRLQEEEL